MFYACPKWTLHSIPNVFMYYIAATKIRQSFIHYLVDQIDLISPVDPIFLLSQNVTMPPDASNMKRSQLSFDFKQNYVSESEFKYSFNSYVSIFDFLYQTFFIKFFLKNTNIIMYRLSLCRLLSKFVSEFPMRPGYNPSGFGPPIPPYRQRPVPPPWGRQPEETYGYPAGYIYIYLYHNQSVPTNPSPQQQPPDYS